MKVTLYELHALELQVTYSEVVSYKYPMAYKGNKGDEKGGGGGGGVKLSVQIFICRSFRLYK